jgi:hypothetical protein
MRLDVGVSHDFAVFAGVVADMKQRRFRVTNDCVSSSVAVDVDEIESAISTECLLRNPTKTYCAAAYRAQIETHVMLQIVGHHEGVCAPRLNR